MSRRRMPFGAAPARLRRPRTADVPVATVHPDDAYAGRQDHLWGLYEAEQAQDRRDDHEGRPWQRRADVVALPVAGRGAGRAAA